MTTRFNYTTFLNYYTDPRNVSQDASLSIHYYHKSAIPHVDMTGDTTITIHGEKYYIKNKPRTGTMLSDSIQFTLPTTIPGKPGILWDFHYHFGMKTIDSNNLLVKKPNQKPIPTNVVYFHKTIQNPQLNNKKPFNCYFLSNQPIDTIAKIGQIDCLETKDSKMTKNFPMGSDDLKIIQELIRRPFYGVQYGGRKHGKRQHLTKKRSRRPTKTRKIIK